MNCLYWLEYCSSHMRAGVRTFLLAIPAFFTPYRKMLLCRPLLQLKVCKSHLCLIFSPHLLKCINPGFLFICPSVCWRGGGGHRGSPADWALGICLLGLQQADVGLLQPKSAHKQYLAACLVCLQLCGFLWRTQGLNPGLELLINPRFDTSSRSINPLLAAQLCKETSSLTQYEWAEVLNLGLIFFHPGERNCHVSRRNNFWFCFRYVIFAKGQKRFLNHRQPEGYNPGEDEGEAQLEIKIAGHVTQKKTVLQISQKRRV